MREPLTDKALGCTPQLTVEAGRTKQHQPARPALRCVLPVGVRDAVGHNAVDQAALQPAVPVSSMIRHASASSHARSSRARVRDEIFLAFA